ncbi:carbohydrate ABC transporter permease [Halapricum desulfuricans]|uniref:ABC-type sugar transport system, permease component n=1 Tax=Halapricum desulfuricans TaxID=2841257 RepID=A0A897NXD4_9EURY|nr:sugar ABC transporter permease [Halapricum desulfuricans]QSG16235.1 ABC-type sugar transport system, permease component [Halapricum desulfuricans]
MSTDTDRTNARLLARPLNWLETRSDAVFAYLLLGPAFLLLAVVAFFPLIQTFRFSLRADAILSADPFGEFIGFEHYVELLTGETLLPQQFLDPSFQTPILQQALFATLAFAILSVLLETAIGFGQALILDQDFRGRRWVRVAIIIPYAIPIVIQAMIFYLMFSTRVGFATEFMQSIGVFGSNPLSTTTDSFLIVLVADVWKTSAFMALLILAGLQSIDRQLYDVAKVTGASPWQRFKYITLPLISGPLLVAMLFRTMDAMRIYGLIDATAGCQTVPSMSCLVVTAFNETRRWASASAVAFLTAVVISVLVLLYLLGLRDSESGLT